MHSALDIGAFFPFTPTESQRKVINDLERFTFSKTEHPIFLLRGYAGTGKSSLIGAYARALTAANIPIELLAPTGRAAKVLQNYCGIPAHTIHRVIYRQKIVGGETTYDVGYNKSEVGTIYIVDEASMISNHPEGFSPFGSGRLLDDLTDFCFSVDNAKILLIGDDAQLPPVGTELSPALDPSYLRGYCSELHAGVLSDIVRQEGASEIVFTSFLLRSRILDLMEGKPWTKPLLPMPTQDREISVIGGYDLPDMLEHSFRTAGKEETVLITRSNKDAEEYNRSIRHHTLYYDDEVIPGEHMMVVRNSYLYTPKDEEGKVTSSFIANGEILKVLGTYRSRDLHGFKFREAEFVDSSGAFVSANIIIDGLYNGSPALTPEQREALYDSVVLDYPECTSRRALFLKLREDPYLNALQIKYSYAMTCHKAQGGQWKDVYLSFGYLTPEMIDLTFCRWLYTAITRATDHLYILNPPSFIFGEG